MNKICTKCGIEKRAEQFYADHSRSDGKCLYCKDCMKQARRLYAQTDAGKAKIKAIDQRRRSDPVRRMKRQRQRRIREKADPTFRERARDKYLARHRASPRYALCAILANKKYRGDLETENPVTTDELMSKWKAQNGKCALSGLTMTWAPGKYGPSATSLSVDRINPELGYTRANTRLVCHCVNSFRGRMSDTELLFVARALVVHMEQSDEIRKEAEKARSQSSAHADPTWAECSAAILSGQS